MVATLEKKAGVMLPDFGSIFFIELRPRGLKLCWERRGRLHWRWCRRTWRQVAWQNGVGWVLVFCCFVYSETGTGDGLIL
jgi:hypothetical protein